MKIIVRKRGDLKYMPSYKWESLGFHVDGSTWFSYCHKTKTEAIASAERTKTPIKIGNRSVLFDVQIIVV